MLILTNALGLIYRIILLSSAQSATVFVSFAVELLLGAYVTIPAYYSYRELSIDVDHARSCIGFCAFAAFRMLLLLHPIAGLASAILVIVGFEICVCLQVKRERAVQI